MKTSLLNPPERISITANSQNSATDRPTRGTDKPISHTKAVEFKAAVIGGCLLSVNAGCINAITLLETGVRLFYITILNFCYDLLICLH